MDQWERYAFFGYAFFLVFGRGCTCIPVAYASAFSSVFMTTIMLE